MNVERSCRHGPRRYAVDSGDLCSAHTLALRRLLSMCAESQSMRVFFGNELGSSAFPDIVTFVVWC